MGVGRSPIDLWREAPRLSPSLEGYDAEPLRRSFEHCRNALARGSRVMATRLRTIPEPRYSAAAALLTWVRAAREVIDGNWPPEARVQNLARFRDQTERAVSGKPPEHADPMWPALSAVVATYGLDPAWALTALDEMGLDLADRAVEDAEHFKACCRALGGNLGLCAGSILGVAPRVHPHEAAKLYRKWGIALQIVSHLRDFARDFDAHPRRVYLPADSFAASGLTPFKIRAWTDPDDCARFVRGWTKLASDQLRAARDLRAAASPDTTKAIDAMTRLASDVLAVLDRDPSRLVRGARIEPPVSLTARVMGAARLGRVAGRGVGR
ncbi:MAG: squalene/phytoene synthase family protein [Phycisphaerales bacterium]